jgi:poly(beta-D-mannuronate) lyase
VEGNFFFGLRGGVRAYGKDNTIVGNYFENNGGIGLYLSDGKADGTYIGIERMLVAHNTLVNDGVSARGGDLPPVTVTFANNLIRKDGGNFVSEGPGWQVKYEGNIFWGAASPGTVPPAGFRKVDPLLVRDPADGISRLGAGSPAIDAAVGSYGLTEDLDGQPRMGTADVGADERSTAPVRRRPLGPRDVGPDAPAAP